MTGAQVWSLVGLTAATGVAWAMFAGGPSVTCSSEDVMKAVPAMARHRVEQISDDYDRNPLDRPSRLVGDAIRSGSAVWKLGYIRDRGADLATRIRRCTAVLTVKGTQNSRARFTVDYTVEQPAKGDMLIT